MFEFIRQLVSLGRQGRVGLFFFFFLFVWGLWGLKVRHARRYAPYTGTYPGFASVVVPVVDEPEDIFREVITRIAAQNPYEIIVVVNGPENLALEQIAREFNAKFVWMPKPSKRMAVAAGVARAIGDIVVLVDSDTLWEENCLQELLRPFADPKVGGVTTHQEIGNAKENLVTRFASWMEKARSHWSMPAMSVHGTVGCLPGRTIAFRTPFLKRAMSQFLTERFLGYHPEISDDRSLTNLCLKAGYKTVYQRTARVQTPAPTTLKKFVKQQYRWSRGSQYNTVMMTPWMSKNATFLGILYWADTIIPFWLAGIYAYTLKKIVTLESGHASAIAKHAFMALLGSILSLMIRQIWIYKDDPKEALWLPVILFMVSALMVPIRILGFLTMGFKAGWGTRKGAVVSEKNKSLQRFAPVAAGFGLGTLFYQLDKRLVG